MDCYSSKREGLLLIELKNVSKYYNTDNVVTLGLSNINLKLNKNEIVAIVGDSGAGKSTLLNVICGVDTYDDGELLFKGNETSYFNQTDMDNYRKEHVAFIFQNYNVIDSYTVLYNVMVPLLIRGIPKKEAKVKAKELIERVGLSHRIHNKGMKLSGGEKQRCVIARALASDCEILACDEPTGNLDSKSGKEIIELIHEVAKDKLVLIVTHNFEEVERIVTRKIKVADGKIVEDFILKPVEEDELEKVSFSGTKVKKTTILGFGIQNILSTPKKTIFTLVVFLLMSMLTFYLYLSCVASSQVSFFDPDTSFVNNENNRLVAYMHDRSAIDENVFSSIQGTYYKNSFYEDYLLSLHVFTRGSNAGILHAAYTPYSLQYKHITGQDTLQNELECYIIFPKSALDTYSMEYTKRIGNDCKIYLQSFGMNLIGFGSSEYISKPVIQTKKDLTELVLNEMASTDLNLKLTIPSINETIQFENRYRGSANYFKVVIPLKYQAYENEFDFSLTLKEMYGVKDPDFKIEYGFSGGTFYFSSPLDYIPEIDGTYEISVYANNPTKEMQKLKSKGLNVIRPSVDFKEVSKNQLLFYGYVAISTVIVFVFCFVSYIILSRIYISKNKEYAVLRTLGVVKKNMAWIVRAEILGIALASSILAFLFFYILYYSLRLDFLNVVTYNSFGITLMYYFIIILFSLYIAQRFNKRLFKFSAQTSLRNEVAKND